ncbi:hypothetical protein KC336_g3 [Hortaea werneckii]|nr:hypothetical protein KC336_g3 [Hortaea werneckii]
MAKKTRLESRENFHDKVGPASRTGRNELKARRPARLRQARKTKVYKLRAQHTTLPRWGIAVLASTAANAPGGGSREQDVSSPGAQEVVGFLLPFGRIFLLDYFDCSVWPSPLSRGSRVRREARRQVFDRISKVRIEVHPMPFVHSPSQHKIPMSSNATVNIEVRMQHLMHDGTNQLRTRDLSPIDVDVDPDADTWDGPVSRSHGDTKNLPPHVHAVLEVAVEDEGVEIVEHLDWKIQRAIWGRHGFNITSNRRYASCILRNGVFATLTREYPGVPGQLVTIRMRSKGIADLTVRERIDYVVIHVERLRKVSLRRTALRRSIATNGRISESVMLKPTSSKLRLLCLSSPQLWKAFLIAGKRSLVQYAFSSQNGGSLPN